MSLYERDICELMWNITSIDDVFCLKLSSILENLKMDLQNEESKDDGGKYQEYVCCLFCMIGYIRDIMDGCGERDLYYHMIYIWYTHFPVLALFALHKCFLSIDNIVLSYGSWKDLKYFCRYIANISYKGHPLILSVMQIANQQLWNDYNENNCCKMSFLCKWVPKETGAFSWVFNALSNHWDPDYGHKGFAKKKYRQFVSSLKLKVCTDHGQRKVSHYYDSIFIGDYVRGIICKDSSVKNDWLIRWDHLVRSFHPIHNAVPVIELSSEMNDNQLYHIIGYTCLLLAKSKNVKRVLIISSVPIWLDVSEYLGSFDILVEYLWSYCENSRTRANWSDVIAILNDAVYAPVQLFFFGVSFPVESLCCIKHNFLSIVLWNVGSSYMYINHSVDLSGFIFMSGRSATIMRNFCNENELTEYSHVYNILQQPRFNQLRQYVITLCH